MVLANRGNVEERQVTMRASTHRQSKRHSLNIRIGPPRCSRHRAASGRGSQIALQSPSGRLPWSVDPHIIEMWSLSRHDEPGSPRQVQENRGQGFRIDCLSCGA